MLLCFFAKTSWSKITSCAKISADPLFCCPMLTTYPSRPFVRYNPALGHCPDTFRGFVSAFSLLRMMPYLRFRILHEGHYIVWWLSLVVSQLGSSIALTLKWIPWALYPRMDQLNNLYDNGSSVSSVLWRPPLQQYLLKKRQFRFHPFYLIITFRYFVILAHQQLPLTRYALLEHPHHHFEIDYSDFSATQPLPFMQLLH